MITFIDNVAKRLKEIEKLATEASAKWTKEDLEMFTKFQDALMVEPTDFIIVGPGVKAGEISMSPGHKLDALRDVLRDPMKLPRRMGGDEGWNG